MGPGRRMRKQGPPEPLSASQFSALKKNKAKSAQNTRGKKRSASGEILARNQKNAFKSPAMMSGAISETKVVEFPKTNETSRPNGHPILHSSKKAKHSNGTANGVGTGMGSEDSSEDVDVEDDDMALEEDDDGGVVLEGLLDEDMDEDMIPDNDSFMGGSDSDVMVSDEDEKRPFVFSEDEDQSDIEEQLTAANMEALSHREDARRAQQAAEAQQELEESALQTNIVGDRPDVLDDLSDDGGARVKTTLLNAPDLTMLRTRITDTVRVLEDFAKLSQPGRSRSEYTSQLLSDICAYYGYSEYLAELLFNLFSPREAFEFFEANETQRPLIIRTNTLKTHRRELAQALINRGVTVEPASKWSKLGLTVFDAPVPIGATPEYLAGQYMIQAQSSFLPVMALAPEPNERVLDMAAAPGGKTTHIAALMRNTGCIFANDSNKRRAKGLIGNIHRLGAKNVIVSSYDARAFPTLMPSGFDRVLLDAPCSGTGVIAKDPSVKTNKTQKDFMQLPHLQKQLLLAAIDSCNHNSKAAFVTYSTCSVTVEENEMVVQYALSKRSNVKLVETGLAVGKEGFVHYRGKRFNDSMSLTRRYYPHTYNVDGFFVAKLKKTGPTPKDAIRVSVPGAIGSAVANNNGNNVNGSATNGQSEDEEDLKAPIEGSEIEDNFGGWEEEEDSKYLEQSRRKWLRRKGLDPRSSKFAGKNQSSGTTANVKGARMNGKP